MKKNFILCLCLLHVVAYAQNVGIGTREPKNKLHVAGGLRIDSLANKKDSGLILHNALGDVFSLKLTGDKKDVLHGDGTFSSNATLADGAWSLNGNAGTDSIHNFLGTTDNRPLNFGVGGGIYGRFSLRNISLGHGALGAQFSDDIGGFAGVDNIALGSRAVGVSAGSRNVGIGGLALGYFAGEGNVAIGANAMFGGVTGPEEWGEGNGNVAIGSAALAALHSGSGNVAIGTEALTGRGTGQGMTGMSASDNVAIGRQAMFEFAGESSEGQPSQGNNTAVGTYAQRRNQFASYNTSIGQASLHNNTSGNYNMASGSQSLFFNTGSYNTATGFKSMYSNTGGANNTASGFKALNFNTTGSQNAALGFEALNTNTTGSNNTAIGYRADVTSGNFSNATAIGYNTKVSASNKVRIGNASVTKIEGQVPFTTPSDGRYKFNVREDVKGLAFIMKLRPVTYQFDVDKFDNTSVSNGSDIVVQAAYHAARQLRRTGFIAQEVEVAAKTSAYDFSGIDKPMNAEDHYSLSYESFVVPLVKAIQEQQRMIEQLQAIVKQQQEQISELKNNKHAR